MSMGTVFTLNSVALFLFPVIGWAIHLNPQQFGLWSALAIHDTSSVIGAAAKVRIRRHCDCNCRKLTRALWIFPVALIAAATRKNQARIRFPWFILLFCLAALANSYLTQLNPVFVQFNRAGHIGLALSLFLIGTGISKRLIKQTGIQVTAHGIVLWIAVASATLLAIRAGWLR